MKRAFWCLVWITVSTVVCSAQSSFFFPQVADGGGWKTTIFVTNPAAANTNLANVTITFTKSDGTTFNVAFVDSNGIPAGTGSLGFQVAGGQTRKFVSTGVGGAVTVGFGAVSSTQTITGTAVFSQFAGDHLLSEAAVPSSQPLARQAIFVDTQNGYFTGLAYASPVGAANLSLQLMNTDGVQVLTTTRFLKASSQNAAFVHELFPGLPPLVGSLQIISDVPVPAMALRFSPDFSAFTTLPTISLASLLNQGLQWFEHRSVSTPLTSIARLLGAFHLRIA
jgi:hypothetical protein